jgi:Mg2+/Co2+ transporter CorB
MMSLNRYRLRHLEKKGNQGAKRSADLLKRPDRLIGVILIGNNLVNNVAAAIATLIAIRLYGEDAVLSASVILTMAVLIFAEVTPKTIAALYPEKVAFHLAGC